MCSIMSALTLSPCRTNGMYPPHSATTLPRSPTRAEWSSQPSIGSDETSLSFLAAPPHSSRWNWNELKRYAVGNQAHPRRYGFAGATIPPPAFAFGQGSSSGDGVSLGLHTLCPQVARLPEAGLPAASRFPQTLDIVGQTSMPPCRGLMAQLNHGRHPDQVSIQNNKSHNCFIVSLNTTSRTERPGSNPRARFAVYGPLTLTPQFLRRKSVKIPALPAGFDAPACTTKPFPIAD